MEQRKVSKSSFVAYDSLEFDGGSTLVKGVVDLVGDLESGCIYRDTLYWSCSLTSLRGRMRYSYNRFYSGEI